MIDEVLSLLKSNPRHWWPSQEVADALGKKKDATLAALYRSWSVWNKVERRRSPVTRYWSWEWRWKGRKK